MDGRRRSTRRCLVAAAITSTLIGACTPARVTPLAAPTTAPPPPASPPASSTAPPAPATWAAADGVHASWVERENDRTGNPNWRIPAGAATGIAGFAASVYAAVGDAVTLYVSSSAPAFHAEAYRVGYYHGAGARLVWRSPVTPGHLQPPCHRQARTNMVSCANWRPSLTVAVDSAFVPGDYLIKLVGSRGEQSYVPLTVWDPSSRAAYLVKNDVFTWQAWNAYGGYDLYQGVGSCPAGDYPLCTRARVVSFDRPYSTFDGAGDFLALELPLVQFVEQHGLDVTYATDITLVDHPAFASAHRALLSLGHDECWDLRERRAVIAAESHGVNIVFFGASAILRHVRVQDSPLGPHRQMVDYRDPAEDPLNGHGDPLDVTGNTWAEPPANWPATTFVGAMYVGYIQPGRRSAPFVVADARAWIFAGTRVHDGTAVPGVIASDVDAFDPAAHPANVQLFGHSAVPVAGSQVNAQYGSVYYSDMTYYTDPVSRAGVLDTGTNNWIPALVDCSRARQCPAPFVQKVTANLLGVFGSGPAGRRAPARPNWRTLAPY